MRPTVSGEHRTGPWVTSHVEGESANLCLTVDAADYAAFPQEKLQKEKTKDQ